MTGIFQDTKDLSGVAVRAIGSNSRQFLGSYITDDGVYDLHLTATLQGAKPMTAGPYPKDVSQCMGCEADIVWMKTKGGKGIPVNVLPTDSKYRGPRPGELRYIFGDHQCHFDTCTK